MSPRITVIDLSAFIFDCGICDVHVEQPRSTKTYGVARYEDEVVPDGHTGDWGGMSVCERCYRIERSLHQDDPQAFIPFQTIRRISLGGGQ